jgi:hypothetical protein
MGKSLNTEREHWDELCRLGGIGNAPPQFVAELLDKFGLAHPDDCEYVTGKGWVSLIRGKVPFRDWDEKWELADKGEFLETIICSACPFSGGAEAMIGHSPPCSIWRGGLGALTEPHLCAIITWKDMSEGAFLATIQREHGDSAVQAFLQKRETLAAASARK